LIFDDISKSKITPMRLLIFFFSLSFIFSGQILAQTDCFTPIVHEKDPAKMGQKELQEYYQKLHDAQEELVGCEAPNFTATTLAGDTVELSELKGKIVVLNFWFIACPPCRAEMPGLKQLADTYAKREDVVLLALATDGNEALKKFLQKREIGFKVVPDARDLSDRYRITGYPTTLVLDKEGKVFSVHIGGASNEKQASKLIFRGIDRDIKKNS